MTLAEFSVHQTLLQEIDRLNACCAQRGARLQVLRESLRDVDWQHFCQDHPEAHRWFDADGVPTPCVHS